MSNFENRIDFKKTILRYCEEIAKILEEHPEIISDISDGLEVTKADFVDYISGSRIANISFYDQALELAKNLKKSREHKKELKKDN